MKGRQARRTLGRLQLDHKAIGSNHGPGCVGSDYKEPMTKQSSLHTFYAAVQHTNPKRAALMSNDVLDVALESLHADKSVGQEAADRLREKSQELPEALRGVLDEALAELGYS